MSPARCTAITSLSDKPDRRAATPARIALPVPLLIRLTNRQTDRIIQTIRPANCAPSVECVVRNVPNRFCATTGKAAIRLARSTPLPYEPIRHNRNEMVWAVLMPSTSNPIPLKLMSSPNHLACSAASAWQ
jgi:hypothetical protein